jgi:hypothetical protein
MFKGTDGSVSTPWLDVVVCRVPIMSDAGPRRKSAFCLVLTGSPIVDLALANAFVAASSLLDSR